MTKLPFFRVWPAALMADEAVRELSLPEFGLFWACILHAWLNDGIPADGKRLAKVLSVSGPEFRRLWPAVSRFFYRDGERLRWQPMEEERQAAHEKSRLAASSVRVRWDKERTTEPIRTYSERIDSVIPRASESVSVSDSVSAESSDFTVDELEISWSRHRKNISRETKPLVFSMIFDGVRTGKVDLATFRARHGPYCDYWERHGWQYCSLTLWGWVENGMQEAPPEPVQEVRATGAAARFLARKGA
jgi:uncharacterized protein YdaU (DUF1376 family)